MATAWVFVVLLLDVFYAFVVGAWLASLHLGGIELILFVVAAGFVGSTANILGTLYGFRGLALWQSRRRH